MSVYYPLWYPPSEAMLKSLATPSTRPFFPENKPIGETPLRRARVHAIDLI